MIIVCKTFWMLTCKVSEIIVLYFGRYFFFRIVPALRSLYYVPSNFSDMKFHLIYFIFITLSCKCYLSVDTNVLLVIYFILLRDHFGNWKFKMAAMFIMLFLFSEISKFLSGASTCTWHCYIVRIFFTWPGLLKSFVLFCILEIQDGCHSRIHVLSLDPVGNNILIVFICEPFESKHDLMGIDCPFTKCLCIVSI